MCLTPRHEPVLEWLMLRWASSRLHLHASHDVPGIHEFRGQEMPL